MRQGPHHGAQKSTRTGNRRLQNKLLERGVRYWPSYIAQHAGEVSHAASSLTYYASTTRHVMAHWHVKVNTTGPALTCCSLCRALLPCPHFQTTPASALQCRPWRPHAVHYWHSGQPLRRCACLQPCFSPGCCERRPDKGVCQGCSHGYCCLLATNSRCSLGWILCFWVSRMRWLAPS